MRKLRRKNHRQDAELDITAFMNLMIVLVPVLLLGMVFSQISVIDIKLPESASVTQTNEKAELNVELIIRKQFFRVNLLKGQQGTTIREIPLKEGEYDFETLSLVLQELKRQLKEQGHDKRNITILSEGNTDYQTIISTMDTVRSYKAVVVASVVDAVLFPDIAFGDAPANPTNKSKGS